MNVLILFIGWSILLVLIRPLALLALILFLFLWLASLPLRLIAMTLEAVFALVRGLKINLTHHEGVKLFALF